MPDFRHALILQHLLSSPRRSLSTLGVLDNTTLIGSFCYLDFGFFSSNSRRFIPMDLGSADCTIAEPYLANSLAFPRVRSRAIPPENQRADESDRPELPLDRPPRQSNSPRQSTKRDNRKGQIERMIAFVNSPRRVKVEREVGDGPLTSRPISTKTPSPAGTFADSIAGEPQTRNER